MGFSPFFPTCRVQKALPGLADVSCTLVGYLQPTKKYYSTGPISLTDTKPLGKTCHQGMYHLLRSQAKTTLFFFFRNTVCKGL